MAAIKRLPDINRLLTWTQQGLTQEEICQRIYDETGYLPSRSSVSAALSRAGKSKTMPRYEDTIPWRVKQEHLREYAPRMLRLLGRKRSGTELTPEEQARLDGWLNKLDDENAVVAYDPEFRFGFVYVDREPDDDPQIPIRKGLVRLLD
tara:strand:- start:2968 stop:3414 length:447 start_codon:yes stop_codon:yes gene_type:complete